MSESLNVIKRRTASVANVHKVTRAMEMISAAKLNRLKGSLFAFRPYFGKLQNILNNFLTYANGFKYPLLTQRPEVKKRAVCVIASEAGLCGIYNHVIINAAANFINRFDPGSILMVTVGKEATDYFSRRGFKIVYTHSELRGRYSRDIANKMADELTGIFLNQEADEVYLVYAHFESTLRHLPRVEKFLNIDYTPKIGTEYIIEPDKNKVLEELLPLYLYEKLHLALLESFTSEHSARMIAMKSATDNAEDLMDSLTLLKNKLRQSTITREVIEIASAAEALKG